MDTVEPYSGDMLPSVARFSSDTSATPGPKNSTNLPTTPRRRSSSVTVSTRSVAVVPGGRAPVSSTPITFGVSSDTGWPSNAASASIPPTPHPTTPSPLTIGVCESVPTSVSGIGAPGGVDPHHPGQVFEVHLVTDPGARRHDPDVGEGLLRPAQHPVALTVAGVFDLHVAGEGVGGAEDVDRHRMVDHQIDRQQRIQPATTERGHGVTHRRQIDHRRHAREVLHQHPGRTERDLPLCVIAPPSQRRHIVGPDERRPLVTKQVLQQDLQRVRQLGDAELVLQAIEPKDLVGTVTDP